MIVCFYVLCCHSLHTLAVAMRQCFSAFTGLDRVTTWSLNRFPVSNDGRNIRLRASEAHLVYKIKRLFQK